MAINQLKAGALLSYISIALSNIIALVYTPYMLRMLGQSEYGLYSLVASVNAYLTNLDLCFGNAIVRYTAKFRAEGEKEKQYEMFGMFLLLYIGIGVVSFLGGLMLYFNIDTMFGDSMSDIEQKQAATMMLLMTFNLAFTFPMSIFGSIITAYEDFIFQRLVSLVRIILNPIIIILLLAIGYKAIAMVVVTTIFNVATLLINYWYCKHKIKIEIRFGYFDWGFFKEISAYSFWIFLNAIMDRIYYSTGQFVLGVYKGTVAVAVYALAIQLHSIYMGFSTAISGVFLPRVTAMISNKVSDDEVSNLFIRTGRIQYIVLAFVLSGFILFGKPFIILWAGEGYEDTYLIALLFFVPVTIPLIQNLGITILQAKNKMKFRSILYVVMAIASLGLSIPLAKIYGGVGCAIAFTISVIFGQIITMNIYYQIEIKINIIRFWKEIIKMSIAPCVLLMGGFYCIHYFSMINISNLILAIILYSIIYLPIFWFVSMNKYERNLFISPVLIMLKRFHK